MSHAYWQTKRTLVKVAASMRQLVIGCSELQLRVAGGTAVMVVPPAMVLLKTRLWSLPGSVVALSDRVLLLKVNVAPWPALSVAP